MARRTDPMTGGFADLHWTTVSYLLEQRRKTKHKKNLNKKVIVLVETLADTEMETLVRDMEATILG